MLGVVRGSPNAMFMLKGPLKGTIVDADLWMQVQEQVAEQQGNYWGFIQRGAARLATPEELGLAKNEQQVKDDRGNEVQVEEYEAEEGDEDEEGE